jgi:hypothetical protein
MTRRERAPYKDIDPPVRSLVRVLNRFPGVHTYTSCGGHAEITNSCQEPEGRWYVDSHIDRTDEGWASLEFFAWMQADVFWERETAIEFLPLAKAPYLNMPGQMIFFRWAGLDPKNSAASADACAETLTEYRKDYYITAHQAARWDD